MSQTQDKIESILREAGLSHSLQSEALKHYTQVQDDLASCKEELSRCISDRDSKMTELSQSLDKIEQLTHNLNVWSSRLSEIVSRENEMTRLEVESACAEKRVDDHKEMVSLIFRSPVVTRTMSGIAAGENHGPDGIHYATPVGVSETVTETTS